MSTVCIYIHIDIHLCTYVDIYMHTLNAFRIKWKYDMHGYVTSLLDKKLDRGGNRASFSRLLLGAANGFDHRQMLPRIKIKYLHGREQSLCCSF